MYKFTDYQTLKEMRVPVSQCHVDGNVPSTYNFKRYQLRPAL